MSITFNINTMVTPVLIFTINEYNFIPRKLILASAVYDRLSDQIIITSNMKTNTMYSPTLYHQLVHLLRTTRRRR